jgi:hypothetical protein
VINVSHRAWWCGLRRHRNCRACYAMYCLIRIIWIFANSSIYLHHILIFWCFNRLILLLILLLKWCAAIFSPAAYRHRLLLLIDFIIFRNQIIPKLKAFFDIIIMNTHVIIKADTFHSVDGHIIVFIQRVGDKWTRLFAFE